MYDEVYKCRLCGAVFTEGSSSVRRWCIKWVNEFCSAREEKQENTPDPIVPHFCDDESIGVADFQGYKKRPEN